MTSRRSFLAALGALVPAWMCGRAQAKTEHIAIYDDWDMSKAREDLAKLAAEAPVARSKWAWNVRETHVGKTDAQEMCDRYHDLLKAGYTVTVTSTPVLDENGKLLHYQTETRAVLRQESSARQEQDLSKLLTDLNVHLADIRNNITGL